MLRCLKSSYFNRSSRLDAIGPSIWSSILVDMLIFGNYAIRTWILRSKFMKAQGVAYRNLGRTGLKVSQICLGTAFRGQADENTCIRVIDRAIDLGCNFIDTALYGGGQSETFVGKALKDKRDDIVLCTKVFGSIGNSPNHVGLSRLNLLRALEDSLRRLQTDYVDLYLMHAFDANTPLEETLRAVDDMVRQGKVRYIGCSRFPAWKVMESLWISDVHNWEKLVCIQNQYNLLNRGEIEAELIPLCEQFGLGIMTFSPLAIGLLTGKFRRGQTPPPGTPWSEEKLEGLSPGKYNFKEAMTGRVDRIIQTLIEISAKHGQTPAQIAIAWVLAQDQISAPILGADLPEHVDEIFAGLNCQLDSEDLASLDQVSRVEPIQRYA